MTKIIFLDIDGVLVNEWSLRNRSAAHPTCVAALNLITNETKAEIVVSSTWRRMGFGKMQNGLKNWGVTGRLRGLTPDLSYDNGKLVIGVERGKEIQDWLSKHPCETFVILDDDDDMGQLKPRLVQTSYPDGLTLTHALCAIQMLR